MSDKKRKGNKQDKTTSSSTEEAAAAKKSTSSNPEEAATAKEGTEEPPVWLSSMMMIIDRQEKLRQKELDRLEKQRKEDAERIEKQRKEDAERLEKQRQEEEKLRREEMDRKEKQQYELMMKMFERTAEKTELLEQSRKEEMERLERQRKEELDRQEEKYEEEKRQMEKRRLEDEAKRKEDMDKQLRKACEFNRLCDIRGASSSLSSLGLNQTCCTVMCLELAATAMDHPVDRKDAVRLAGVTKKIYVTSYKTLESVLNLQSVLGMRDLAVQFGCIGAVDKAQEILSRYKEDFITRTGSDNAIDFSKPMFTIAALYTVCRHQKQRVDKSKMIAAAGVKRSTFDQTCTDFEKFVNQLLGEKKTGKLKQTHWLDDLEKSFEEEEESPLKKKKSEANVDDNGAPDDYEEWKKRILEAAAIATKGQKT